MWLKQLTQESNQIGRCDIMGPTPGSRARVVSREHPGLGRGGPSSPPVAIHREDAVFSTQQLVGRESSGEGKLEETIGQHDGRLPGEMCFLL